jgi:hypothetical protein
MQSRTAYLKSLVLVFFQALGTERRLTATTRKHSRYWPMYLKPEWWGSPLVQEKKYQEKPVKRE